MKQATTANVLGSPSLVVRIKSWTKSPLTFTVNVEGGNPNVVPVYVWSISAGKIVDGQDRLP